MNQQEREASDQDAGHVPALSPLTWWATRSASTMAAATSRYIVTENMVGHKLGEFALTRFYKGHGTKAERSQPAQVSKSGFVS